MGSMSKRRNDLTVQKMLERSIIQRSTVCRKLMLQIQFTYNIVQNERTNQPRPRFNQGRKLKNPPFCSGNSPTKKINATMQEMTIVVIRFDLNGMPLFFWLIFFGLRFLRDCGIIVIYQ